jgi:hypothetical protein
MNQKTFEWLKTTIAPSPPEILSREKVLLQRQEQKDGLAIRDYGNHFEPSTDKYQHTSLSDMMGRDRSNGLLIECGRFLELWVSPEPIHLGTGNTSKKVIRGKLAKEQGESAENIAARVNHRARKRIRRIVNVNDFRGMYTLTLAPPSTTNNKRYLAVPYEKQRDLDYVKRLFKAFIRRVRSCGGRITYLVVFEEHNSQKTSTLKRGCWHIHFASDTKRETQELVQDLWWHGITQFTDFDFTPDGQKRKNPIQNPGAYLAEYIGKDGAQFGRASLVNKRRYSTSRNVKRPVQQSLGSVGIRGTFELIQYRGKEYRNVFYSSKHIPGTLKYSVTATYMEVP